METDEMKKIAELEKKIRDHEAQIKYLEALVETQTNVIVLANQERMESDKIIEAHERIHGMSHKLESSLNDHKKIDVSSLKDLNIKISVKELMDQGVQLSSVFSEIQKSLLMKRVIMFIKEHEKFVTRIFVGIEMGDMKKSNFEFSFVLIKEALKAKKSVSIKDKKMITDSGSKLYSMIAIPVMYGNDMIGLVYMDNL